MHMRMCKHGGVRELGDYFGCYFDGLQVNIYVSMIGLLRELELGDTLVLCG